MNEFPRDFGAYTLLAELGRGSMGIVYKAEQKSLGRAVALKVLKVPHEWATEETLARFRREGQVMARLSHPDIVAIHDFGIQDDQLFISMDLIGGTSLDRHLRLTLPTVEQSASIVARVARALYAAHQQGIVHRDVKPSNILIDPQGNPKLSDFGLAKVEGAALTQTGGVMGTPLYMSPEQAEGKPTDARTDVYGLGTVLYELLTGSPPFPGATVDSIVHKVLHLEPTPPRSMNARVPIDAETICLKAISKDPQGRYATSLALGEDVERFLKGDPILAERPGLLGRAWRAIRRRKLVAATIFGLSTIAVGAGMGITLLAKEVRRQRDEARRLKAEQEQDREERRRLERAQFLANRLVALEAEAVQLMKADRAADAVELLGEVTEMDPTLSRARLAKGTCQWLLGRNEPAERDFRSYLESEPTDAFAWRLRGLNQVDARENPAAIASYRKAAQLWGVEGADLAAQNGDGDVLIALVERRILRRSLAHPRPWLSEYDPSVVLLVPLKGYPLSTTWRVAYPRLWEIDAPSLLDLFERHEEHPALVARMVQYKRYVPSESLPLVERAIELVPIWPKLWAWRALFLKMSAASPPEVESSYQRALDLCPRYGDARYGRADWKKSNGKFEEALADYRSLLEKWERLRWEEGTWDDKEEALLECARCAVQVGRSDEALAFLRESKERWKVTFTRQKLETDAELKPLRDRPEFQAILDALP